MSANDNDLHSCGPHCERDACVAAREKSLATENSAGVYALRDAAQQALDALAGYRREMNLIRGESYMHGQPCDAEVALRAALEKEQDSFVGLELSEIDAAIDENIKITDYRLRDGVYGAIVDIELLLKEKNERDTAMSKETVWYRCLTHCEESFFEFTPCHHEFDRWMAQEAARNFHYKHDGWDANWPLVFSLHETEGGPELARFEVQREAEPVFYAAAIAKAEEER